ncbi:cytochrome P450 [Streptomyces sparsus]
MLATEQPQQTRSHTLKMRRNPLSYLTSLPDHGDLVQIRAGGWKAYVLCHSDLTQQVLLGDRTFGKGGPVFDKIQTVVENSIVTCPHRDHRRQRRLLQPAFHHERMGGYAQSMTEEINILLASWRDREVIDVPAEMASIISNGVTSTLFTADAAREAARAVRESLDVIFDGVYRQMVMPLPLLNRLPTPANRRALTQRRTTTIRAGPPLCCSPTVCTEARTVSADDAPRPRAPHYRRPDCQLPPNELVRGWR